MTVSIDDSSSTIGPRIPVDVLTTLAEPPPRELNDLIAQLVAFETRKVGAVFLAVGILAAPYAMAQPAASVPPAVGVVTVERQPMTDSYEFNGRIRPINSV